MSIKCANSTHLRRVAAGLKIPDLLGEGPKTVAQLAAAITNSSGEHAKESKLRRLLRYLAGRGIFERGPDAADGTPQYQNNDITNHMRRYDASPMPIFCSSSTARAQSYSSLLQPKNDESNSA